MEESNNLFEVERIEGKMILRGKSLYKIKWVGYDERDWVEENDLIRCDEILGNYERSFSEFLKSGRVELDRMIIKMIEERNVKFNKVITGMIEKGDIKVILSNGQWKFTQINLMRDAAFNLMSLCKI